MTEINMQLQLKKFYMVRIVLMKIKEKINKNKVKGEKYKDR